MWTKSGVSYFLALSRHAYRSDGADGSVPIAVRSTELKASFCRCVHDMVSRARRLSPLTPRRMRREGEMERVAL